MHIVLAGGTGFLGQHLVRFLTARNHRVTVLSRQRTTIADATMHCWDGKTPDSWTAALDGADVVINLAGHSVNCRYTADHCAEIYASRLDSTRVLGEEIANARRPPQIWLNASSATIYRHAVDRPMDEATGEIGSGFSVDVCERWEQELFCAATPATRRRALRTAMVFAAEETGGVFDAFYSLVRCGLGGAMAGGRQYVSWIHADDFCRAVLYLIEHDDLRGPVNIAAPNPLPNREFLYRLRQAANMPLCLPLPKWALKIGAWLRQTEPELLLKSRRVVPGTLLASGFDFRYPGWPLAARQLCGQVKTAPKERK